MITGKLQLKTTPTQIASVIDSAVETVRPAANAKNIHLDVILAPSRDLVAADFDRLQQVVWNLLSNAIKFTLEGGHVQVRMEQTDDAYVQIKVTDSGLGIPADFLPHVFDYFRQQDGSSTRRYGGLGLGLSIVRHIVELHGGTVVGSSEGKGKGASFTVRLPVISGVEE